MQLLKQQTINQKKGDVQGKIYPSTFLGKNQGYITFGAGQPDLPPPKEVYSDMHCPTFQYGLIQGELPLRDKVASYHNIDSDSIVITNGASEALHLSISSLLKPKDRILLTKPYYYSYPELVRFANASPVFLDLDSGLIDFSDFEQAIHKDKIKAVLLNSPANPTGCVEKASTIKKIESLTSDLGIPFIFDEVYSELIYSGEHYSPRKDNAICLHSFSKTFSLCGMRVGYLYSKNKEFVQDIIDWKTHTSMNTSLISQKMALNTFTVPKSYKMSQLKIWKERRDFISDKLSSLGFDFWSPQGAFYVLPKVDDPRKFVTDMFYKHKVITYLGEWFGSPDRVRFSYATSIDNIEKGFKIIKSYLDKN